MKELDRQLLRIQKINMHPLVKTYQLDILRLGSLYMYEKPLGTLLEAYKEYCKDLVTLTVDLREQVRALSTGIIPSDHGKEISNEAERVVTGLLEATKRNLSIIETTDEVSIYMPTDPNKLPDDKTRSHMLKTICRNVWLKTVWYEGDLRKATVAYDLAMVEGVRFILKSNKSKLARGWSTDSIESLADSARAELEHITTLIHNDLDYEIDAMEDDHCDPTLLLGDHQAYIGDSLRNCRFIISDIYDMCYLNQGPKRGELWLSSYKEALNFRIEMGIRRDAYTKAVKAIQGDDVRAVYGIAMITKAIYMPKIKDQRGKDLCIELRSALLQVYATALTVYGDHKKAIRVYLKHVPSVISYYRSAMVGTDTESFLMYQDIMIDVLAKYVE